jgi:predicted nuclease of predicted toxin-antitoxin system
VKFLVDECTGKRLAKLLEKAGFDVVFVGDWKPSATDDEVLEKAEKEDRILITDDKDFGELIFRLGRPSKGVILLRLSTTDPMKRFQVLNDVLKLIDVRGKFVVVGDEAIRVRRIER